MSVTVRSKKGVSSFALRFSSKGMLKFMLLWASWALGTTVLAQTLEIKLVNGRTGRPIAGHCMYVWVGDKSNPSSDPLLETETDSGGSAILRLTHEGAEIENQSQRLACGLQGAINPVVKYGYTISIRTGYVSCQPRPPSYSWLASTEFAIEDVLQHGIVTANRCGKATDSPKPGEVIIFVRPLSWWEKWKQ